MSKYEGRMERRCYGRMPSRRDQGAPAVASHSVATVAVAAVGAPCWSGEKHFPQDLNSSHHHLHECTLLATKRAQMLETTTGDIHTLNFITEPNNLTPLRKFLRMTGLGHTKPLRYKRELSHSDDSTTDNPSSAEPDFGAFEP